MPVGERVLRATASEAGSIRYERKTKIGGLAGARSDWDNSYFEVRIQEEVSCSIIDLKGPSGCSANSSAAIAESGMRPTSMNPPVRFSNTWKIARSAASPTCSPSASTRDKMTSPSLRNGRAKSVFEYRLKTTLVLCGLRISSSQSSGGCWIEHPLSEDLLLRWCLATFLSNHSVSFEILGESFRNKLQCGVCRWPISYVGCPHEKSISCWQSSWICRSEIYEGQSPQQRWTPPD